VLSGVASPKHPSRADAGCPDWQLMEPIGIQSGVQWLSKLSVGQARLTLGRALEKLLAWVWVLSGFTVRQTRESKSICWVQ